MAKSLYRFRELPNGRGYRIVVHIDTAKLLPGGAPDPAWLMRFDYGDKPDGQTKAAYLQGVREEILRQVDAELGRRTRVVEDEGTPQAQEGQEF